MTFNVIDKNTGVYPDVEEIAQTEEWAKNLIYCDIDSFAISEDGALLLMDDCGNIAYCPHDRFDVVFEQEKEDVVHQQPPETEEWNYSF